MSKPSGHFTCQQQHVAAVLFAVGGAVILFRRLSIRARRKQVTDRPAVRRHLAERRAELAKRIKDHAHTKGGPTMRALIVTIATTVALGGCATGCDWFLSPLSNPSAPTNYTVFTDAAVAAEVARGPVVGGRSGCPEPAQRAAHEKWIGEQQRRANAKGGK